MSNFYPRSNKTLLKILITAIVTLGLGLPAPATEVKESVTDAQMTDKIKSLCPPCTQADFRRQLGQARQELYDLGAIKIGPHVGFYDLNDKLIPEAVRTAAKSAFQLFIISHDKSLAQEYPVAFLEEHFPRIQASQDSSDKRFSKLIALYLTRCKDSGKEKCAIPGMPTGMIAGGSAFLVGPSGRELWTANHVIADAVKELIAAKVTTDIRDLINKHYRFEILLFDSDGNLVATPFDNSAQIVFAATPTPMPPDSVDPAIDAIKLELEKPLHAGLATVGHSLPPGTQVYHLGYPQCTGCKESYDDVTKWLTLGSRFPFTDAPSNELRVTLGNIVKAEGSNYSSNADSGPGMSGGPTVTASGEVVGINSRASAEASSDRLQMIMRAVDLAPLKK